jgi:choline dehydrogenase-like flavoprotein
MDRLRDVRFPALAGWNKSYEEIFAVMNEVTFRLMSQFSNNGQQPRPVNDNGEENWYGEKGKGFGYGTVHHAAGTLRMPYRKNYLAAFEPSSVVDEDLQVIGAPNVYVCDMSVMPFSSAANPVRALAALALRLASRLAV